MALNNKKWDKRAGDLEDTLETLVTDEVPFDAPEKLQLAIQAMGAKQQKTLSESLHLNKQKDAEWRKWARAYALVEQVLVAQASRRSVTAIIQALMAHNAKDVRLQTRELIRSLDSWADWGTKDFSPQRPLMIGCSVSGGAASGPGSITCFVRDNITNDVMLLTNQHVALQEFGKDTTVNPTLYQPARNNGGTNANNIATYVRGQLDFEGDAAVAKLDHNILWRNSTRPGGTQPSVAIVGVNRTLPNVGDLVWKCGCMSYISRARVVAINKTSTVPHAKFGGGITFTGQIELKSLIDGRDFQIPGDSGAGLFNSANELIGVMHGGTKGGGIATPIATVLDRLNVRFA